jgi:hypothetical protein
MSLSAKKTEKSESSLSPHEVELRLDSFQRVWNQVSATYPDNVLKLAVLRSMTRSIHSLKSELDPTKKTAEALALLEAEPFIEKARNKDLSLVDLQQVLQDQVPDEPQHRKLPFDLIQKFPKTDFDRFDRTWEFAVLAEALESGWKLYTLDATVSLKDAESVHLKLEKDLWPNGVVLFVESSYLDVPDGMWRGRWFLVGAPGFEPNPSLEKSKAWLEMSDPKIAKAFKGDRA